MGEKTDIQWCHHTFNIVWGCHKVSDECKFCYAEAWSKRVGLNVWGQHGNRRVFGEAHWQAPLKWNRAAEKAGERRRVFCSSMADVFEGHPTLETERTKLWPLIEKTPWLDWLLLTKRPENMGTMVPHRWDDGWPDNVWAGTTVGVRSSLGRLDELRRNAARIHFVSCEPLLEDLGAVDFDGIDWVIIGGESGPKARPFEIGWGERVAFMAARDEAAVFWKQLGAKPRVNDRRWLMRDTHGGDWEEWPAHLRIREFPKYSEARNGLG